MIDFDDDDDDGDGDDEAVVEDPYSGGGYGRPPVAHQFKPGNSGRPKGSRNKPKTFAEELERALDQQLQAQGGELVTPRRFIATEAVRDAMTGSKKDRLEFVKAMAAIEARQARKKKEKPLTLDEILNGTDE